MKLNIIGASVVSALLFSAAASAADPVIVNGGTVHFTGELVNAACAVSTESSNQTVELGQYRTAKLAAVRKPPVSIVTASENNAIEAIHSTRVEPLKFFISIYPFLT